MSELEKTGGAVRTIVETIADEIERIDGELDRLDKVVRVVDRAARDAIPAAKRYEGLWVEVLSEVKVYRLTGGLTNDCWDERVGLSAVGVPVASADQYGVVKGGDTIAIAADGTLFIPAQTASVTYYIAKNGNDNNDGLAADRAFATWNRAYDVACGLSLSRGTGMTFKFGPGDWGRVSVYADSLGCGFVNVTAMDMTEANWPFFTRLDCSGTASTLSYIRCDMVNATNCASVALTKAATIGCAVAQVNSYLRINAGTYKVYKISTSAYFANATYNSFLRISDVDTKIIFEADCDYTSGFLYAYYNSGIVLHASRTAFSGPVQTGLKAYVVTMSTIEIINGTKDSVPGVGEYIGPGGSFCNDSLMVPNATQTVSGRVRFATAAEVTAGTLATVAVSPATLHAAFVASKAANGYVKLPGGIILQWGVKTNVSLNQVWHTVTFPISFPTAVRVVIPIVGVGAFTNDAPAGLWNHTVTTTTSAQIGADISVTNAGNGNLYYLAIGQ